MIRRGYIRPLAPPEEIRVEPSVAIIKDLLAEDIDGHVIKFCENSARIAKPHTKDKYGPVVGLPVVSVIWELTVTMVYVIWDLVLVQYPIPYTMKSKMRLHLLS